LVVQPIPIPFSCRFAGGDSPADRDEGWSASLGAAPNRFFQSQHPPSPAVGGEKRKGFFMAKTLGDITGELTQKVLAPAKAEAAKILQDAKTEAERIVTASKEDAKRMREMAQREAENLRRQMAVDLDTAARNFLIMVEERLEKAVVDPVVEDVLKPVLSDQAFLEQMILELIGGYSRIEILLPEAKKADLDEWFLKKLRTKAAQPLNVRFTDKISFGFKIGLEGSGSHINFSNGLVQVFSEFCSPRFRKHFFSRLES
jgi:V/A-type H+-transporting ATPase subunit E